MVGWTNGPTRAICVAAGSGGRGRARGEDRPHERLHALPSPGHRQAAVAAEQLPRVDIRGHDEQVDELIGIPCSRQKGSEALRDPPTVHLPPVVGDAGREGLGTLLIGLVLGAGAGSAITWRVAMRSVRQSQSAGNHASQSQVGRDQIRKRSGK